MTRWTRPDVDEVRLSLERLHGKLEALAMALHDHSEKLGRLAERTATLEQLGKETKQVVEAWTTAKQSLRLFKWMAGLAGALAGMLAAARGWLQR